MSYLIYNGVSSQQFGILKRCPIQPLTSPKYTEYEIPGREENLSKREENYKDISLSATLGIKERSIMETVYNWLSGAGDLILSTDISKKYKVKQINTTPVYISTRFAELNITFSCSPFARAVNPTIIDLTSATSYTLATNAGTVKGKPIITLKPSGTDPVTISINGEDFVVEIPEAVSTNGYAITIDSEIMIAYYTDTDGNKISCTEYTTGHFPLLHVGENYIKHGGNVAEMSINMNERWY